MISAVKANSPLPTLSGVSGSAVLRVTLCRLTNARRSKGCLDGTLESTFEGLAGTRGRWAADCVVFFAIAAETKAQHTHTPSIISRLAVLIRSLSETAMAASDILRCTALLRAVNSQQINPATVTTLSDPI